MPALPPHFVPDPVEHGLAKVRLKRADAARFELIDPLERLNQGILDKIVGVGELAGPFRQPASGPALKWREVAGEETLERVAIALADSGNQMKRRVERIVLRTIA